MEFLEMCKWYLWKMYNNNSKSISWDVYPRCKLAYRKPKLWRKKGKNCVYKRWSGENPTKLRLCKSFPFSFFLFYCIFQIFNNFILRIYPEGTNGNQEVMTPFAKVSMEFGKWDSSSIFSPCLHCLCIYLVFLYLGFQFRKLSHMH